MKVGIFTFFNAENFGACLQAFALQTFLQQEGHDVKFINYRNPAVEMQYHIFNPSIIWQRKNIFAGLINYFRRYLNLKDRLQKKRIYREFISKYLNIDIQSSSILALDKYEAIIVGSDQVWNFYITKGFCPPYFLEGCNQSIRKISYAASSEQGAFKLFVPYKNRIKECLEKFTSISVREDILKDELLKYTDRPIDVCLDPVFLIPKEEFYKIEIKPIDEDYLLVYHLYPTTEGSSLAEQVAKKNGWRIIEVHAGFCSENDTFRHRQNIGPKEMIGLIHYAKFIITTSFHGTALSIIFNKQFCAIDKGAVYRIKNILQKIDLSNSIIKTANDYVYESIDYSRINEKLIPLKNQSVAFLRNSLK